MDFDVSAANVEPLFDPFLVRIPQFGAYFDATLERCYLLDIELRVVLSRDIVYDVFRNMELRNDVGLFPADFVELNHIVLLPVSVVMLLWGTELKLLSILMRQLGLILVTEDFLFVEALLVSIQVFVQLVKKSHSFPDEILSYLSSALHLELLDLVDNIDQIATGEFGLHSDIF